MSDTAACVNCMFWSAGTTTAFPEANGMCRSHAPQGPSITPGGGGWQSFPPMPSWQWCGDYGHAGPVVVAARKAAA